ncbi:MAG: immunoglobulin-like domain-containing protein [Lachnospiraceae bacterium]|jgi:GH43 family beta-xylosidase|nr:immunoglobulin-like domain-containing protein [Lachnospiraceae bacterium]
MKPKKQIWAGRAKKAIAAIMSAALLAGAMPAAAASEAGSVQAAQAAREELGTTQERAEAENTRAAAGDQAVVDEAKGMLEIAASDPVMGNLNLPTELNGAAITWESSAPEIISDQPKTNEGYADTPAGVVVRGEKDQQVTLTATITYGGARTSKSFPLTVKKKGEAKEYAAYLYIHFNEIQVGTSLQQIYFGVSKDGLQWTALNDNQPILESTVGDKGVRDPYIVRSPEGDKFYLIGTDLDIHHNRYGGNWGQMATIGSQSLVIWESEDLLNWSESRLADVGSPIDAGCTWAPEAIYDETTGEYLVFWSSPLTKLTGDSDKKYIFVSKTRDFVNFTDPELYSEDSSSTIDADIYREGDTYYRLLKEASKGYVYLQSADRLLDYSGSSVSTIGGKEFVNRGMHFQKIDNTAAGCLETYRGRYEGPTMFKFNDRDEWCILVDEYGSSDARGYIPFLTKNLDQPNSVKLAPDNTYTMTDGAKHGTVIPITQEEYDALVDKWGVVNEKYAQPQEDPILEYDFEEEQNGQAIEDKAGDNDGLLFGKAEYRYDEQKESKVLYLDGSSGTYAKLPDGLFDGLDNMTLTMDIKPQTTETFHFDFTVGQDNSRYLFLRIRDNEIRSSITSRGNGQEKSAAAVGSGLLNQWMSVALVMENHKMTLYVNGKRAAEQKGVGVRSISELGSDLISYLGKSFYNDPYFKGSYDNVKVYNRALDQKEISGEEPEPAEKELLLHYDFKEVKDNVIKDVSGKGNDGTIKGNGAVAGNGTLTLPGGSAGSSAAYVELPTGMFDGQDTLTISLWMKNQTGKGNYAGMFFGNRDGQDYWLLNPCNPAGLMKSVFTNSKGSQPYNNEYGISPTNSNQGIPGPVTDSEWGLYTTVITPNSIEAYYNGNYIGIVNKTRTVSDFGKDLVAYLGKSTYNDIFYKGGIKEVKVYANALTQGEVSREYAEELIRTDAAGLGLSEGELISDLELPLTGINGSQIQWKSDNTTYISHEGKVTRPQAGTGNQRVTLTATVSLGEYSLDFTYEMVVLENSDTENRRYLEQIAESFDPGLDILWKDVQLPGQYQGIPITWSADSAYVKVEGGNRAVLTQPAPGDGAQSAVLTAALTLANVTVKKDLKVTIEESVYGYVLSYVVSQEPDMLTEEISGRDNARTDVLHLALSEDGKEYTALNKEKGIFYPTGNKQLGSPSLFRKPDGSFGMIASQDNRDNKVLIYDSEDLIYYGNERIVTLTDSGIVKDPIAEYDPSVMAYRIYWVDAAGQGYEARTRDFVNFTAPAKADYSRERVTGTVPRYAKEYASLGLSRDEYETLEKKYGILHNTGIQKPDDQVIREGETLNLPKKLTLDYSDGSTAQMGVTWDTSKVDTGKAGTYEVTGTVQQTSYNDPLVEMRADPYMIYNEDDEYYYFTGSYPTMNDADDRNRIGYDRLVIRRSKDINGLTDAQEVEVWHDGWMADEQGYHTEAGGTAYYRYFWAPEIHKIGGKWRIITYASLNRNSVWGQMAIFTCEGEDMMNPANWRAEGMVGRTTDGQSLGGFDTTFMEVNGQCYYVTPRDGKIWITTFDPDNVLQPTGPLVELSGANMAWEYNLKTGQGIDEGPAILQHDGKIYVCYSGATVDQHYCVGMIYADADSNLMDPESWTKYPYPLLATSDIYRDKNQYGPGHNSFSIDANGNPIIVYHARTWGEIIEGAQNDGGLNDPGRHARVNSVHFAADGIPVFNMTDEELLAKEFRTVTVKVTVKAKEEPSTETPPTETPSTETPPTEKPEEPKPVPKPVLKMNYKKLVVGVKEKVTLKATLEPAGVTGKLTWKSSNKKIAVVSSNGKVTAKKTGKVRITARAANGKTAVCSITVKKAPKKIILGAKKKTLKRGKTYQVKTKLPAKTASWKITYKSSKKAVAAVSGTGKITAKKRGRATITVRTYNGKTAKMQVTVK